MLLWSWQDQVHGFSFIYVFFFNGPGNTRGRRNTKNLLDAVPVLQC